MEEVSNIQTEVETRLKSAEPDVEVCRAFAKTGVSPITAGNLDQFTPEW